MRSPLVERAAPLMRALLVASASLGLPACGSAPDAAPNAMNGGAWVAPVAAPCPGPSGEVVEHWRAAPAAGIVALKTRDALGKNHTHYRTAAHDREAACAAIPEAEALARLDAAARAHWGSRIDEVPEDTLVVQVWLGSVRSASLGVAPADVDRDRNAHFAAIRPALRRLVAPIPGTYAYVGRVAKADARAFAEEPAVRWMFAYAAFAAPVPSEVGRATGFPPSREGGIAVFDTCAEEASGLERASYAGAIGVECLRSSHGTAVSRLAFAGAPRPHWSAGLTAASTDAPESLASPALWALRVAGANVVVQTLHTVAGEDANDALDLLIAEAAYPNAVVVRAAGNGLRAEPVVHRVLGALDVGALGADGLPLASMRGGNAGSAFGDVERPSLAANGIADAADGAPEGTSFAAPRVGAVAVAALAKNLLPPAPSAAAQLRAYLLATAKSVPCAPDRAEAQRRHEDAVVGAGALAGDAGTASRTTLRLIRREEFARDGRFRMDLPHEPAGARLRVALVFRSVAGAHPLDPSRARADLDLRVVDAAGETLATAQSFDDDEEVTSVGAERARAVIVERANGEEFFDAYLAVAFDEPAGVCPGR